MKRVFNRLVRIDYMIRQKATGTPAQFAEKIGISERSMYGYLKLLKEFGAPIRYSRLRSSYRYTEEGNFCIGFIEPNQ